MAAAAQAGSKRMYSWWWDSHISPKNSKWLQENLTDMDSKVKQMIKLIEEDADSFARRAEMYYKKRPELMKLVEEFYRAYRALAERYDHATGALRQAHRTMTEAFPNQVPFVLTDDSPTASAADSDPRTPDMPPGRATFVPGELQNDALGISSSLAHAVKRNGAYTEEADSGVGRKGLKQLNDMLGTGGGVSHVGRARKGLNFYDEEEKERGMPDSGVHDLKAQLTSELERVSKAELEISTLKNALAKLEAEKECGLRQYEESLERLSNLESEVSRAKEDSRGLNERANNAEAEVQTLKEALRRLEDEKEASFLQYQKCLDKISSLETNISDAQKEAGELNERASRAQIEAESLKQDLDRSETEKEAILVQHKQCLQRISDLEGKLVGAEEEAQMLNERADKAEREVEILKQALIKLTEEKEAAAVQYVQCLETISSLECKLACAEEEAQRLKSELDDGVVKLNGAEERCHLLERSNQTMHSELECLSQKMAAQSEELNVQQKELGRLWTCIQEERLRFVEAETAFQTLQHLHSQSQEELRSMVIELQNRSQIAEDLEAHNQSLQKEVEQVKMENKALGEVNLSSALTIQNLQNDISSLRETIGKLEAEVELRVDQRNALQQEIYCLKEELNDLDKKHNAVLEQVVSVGFNPECLESAVKNLQHENLNLKEVCERDRSEKVALSEKLEVMEKLIEKNAVLENSLSDLNFELEDVRGKVKELEESCQSLLGEKSSLVSEKLTLVSQLQIATDNLVKLTEKNLSSALTMQNLQNDISSFRETIGKLEAEVELQVDQRNALQQEIYRLKEELNDLNKKHNAVLEQVVSVGFNPECLESAVKNLQHENINLKEVCERDRSEIVALLEKLEVMEKLIDKNAVLENSLSDLNFELEEVRGKVKELEESCQSLLGEKSSLVSEKVTLVSQLQIATDNWVKLTEKNNLLEDSLLDANAELKDLRVKLKSLEDSCLLMENEKSDLDSAKGSLISQLDITREGLKDLQLAYAELESKCLRLDDERQSSLQKVDELQVSLDAGKNEHANFVRFSDSQLVSLGLEIRLLQEEGQCRKKEFEEELDKAANAQIEIFVLQKCAQDLEERIVFLSLEYQKLFEASELSKKHISELEHENLDLNFQMKSLFDQITGMRMGLNQVVRTLDANQVCEGEAKQDEILLNYVLIKLQDLQVLLCKMQDEKQQLAIENSVLFTLLEQLQLQLGNLLTAKSAVSQELSTRSEQLLALQGENQKLVEMNEDLMLMITKRGLEEEILMVELKNLQGQLQDLQGAYQKIQEENCKVLDEQRNLMKLFSDLGKEKCDLEEENYAMLAEAVYQNILSIIFRDIICARSVEIKDLSESFNELIHANDSLKGKVKMMERQLNELHAVEAEKTELHKILADLKSRHDEVVLMREDQEKQLIKLSGDYEQQRKETESIHEACQKLESALQKLHGEFLQSKSREEILNDELHKERNEVKLWESQAATLFDELQISAVQETLFEGKIIELIKTCGILEDDNYSKVVEIDQLEERVKILENKNGELKDQMTAHVPALNSLRDSITSLENRTILHPTVDKEEEDFASVTQVEGYQLLSDEQSANVLHGLLCLQELQRRIKAIEKAVVEKEKLVIMENSTANSKLEKAMREITELKSRSSVHGVIARVKRVNRKTEEMGDGRINDHRLQKQTHEISEEGNEVMTKDIVLDQISECSGISRREAVDSDDQMLQIWETTDQDGGIDLTVGNTQKAADALTKQKNHRGHPSIDALVEKELGVDKLEISKRFSGSRQEGNERKVLERLDSDAQKLTNLQITVQDLKRKVEITEKSRKGKGIEYENVKEQLEESEEAIMRLVDANCKLKKSVEDDSLSSDEKYLSASDQSGSIRRRKISEQARRASEKIGRLQLEVQKLQFLLLKLDDENKSRGRTKITEQKMSVLLRDYLYGSGTRTIQKRKKGHFCACVQPSTKGD